MKSASLICALLLAPLIAQAGDFQITINRRKGDTMHKAAAQEGGRNKASEDAFYEVTVTNQSFKPAPALEARYILFVERQELAKKVGSGKVEKTKGTAPIAALEPHASANFTTTSVTLREQSLSGNYIYESGGRVKAKDSLVGVWIKLYNGNTEVGEYINPTTLSSKNKWE